MRRFEGSSNDYEAGRPRRLETNPDGAGGAGRGGGRSTTAAVPAPARAATKQTPVLAQGAGMGGKPSAAVRGVQRVLRSRGYSLGRPGVDGRFGPLTARPSGRLQADSGLVADGIVGPKTRRVVRRIERRAQRPSATQPPQLAHQAGERPRPPRPRPAAPTHGGRPTTGSGTHVDRSPCLAAGLAAFCAAWRSRGGRRPRRRASQPPGSCRSRTSCTSRAAAATRAIAALPRTRARHDGRRPARRRPQPGTDLVPRRRRAQAGAGVGPRGRRPAPAVGAGAGRARDRLRRRCPPRPTAATPTEACARSRRRASAPTGSWPRSSPTASPGAAWSARGWPTRMQQIAEGKARGLVVSDLRRLSRSIVDLGALMEWFRDAGRRARRPRPRRRHVDSRRPRGGRHADHAGRLGARAHREAHPQRPGRGPREPAGPPAARRSATAPTWSSASPRCAPPA